MNFKLFLLLITFYNIQSCAILKKIFSSCLSPKKAESEEFLLKDAYQDNFLMEYVAEKIDGDYLIHSAKVGHCLGVEMALSARVDINYTCKYSFMTALDYAICNKDFDMMTLLLKRNAQIKNGLILAVKYCTSDSKFVKCLIRAGADISLVDQYGYNALCYAQQLHNQEIVDLLTVDMITET